MNLQLLEAGLLERMLNMLDPSLDRKLLEAAVAAVTHFSKTLPICTYVCDLGLKRILSLLDSEGFGVQCNTLALLGALAEFPDLSDRVLSNHALPLLFKLRDQRFACCRVLSAQLHLLAAKCKT